MCVCVTCTTCMCVNISADPAARGAVRVKRKSVTQASKARTTGLANVALRLSFQLGAAPGRSFCLLPFF